MVVMGHTLAYKCMHMSTQVDQMVISLEKKVSDTESRLLSSLEETDARTRDVQGAVKAIGSSQDEMRQALAELQEGGGAVRRRGLDVTQVSSQASYGMGEA